MPSPVASLRSGGSLPPIDPQVIASLRALDDGGDEFLAEIVGLFRAESPSRLAAIRRAASADACRELVSAAHALKGSARTLGLLRLAEVCERIESVAKAGGCPDDDTLRTLDQEYAAVTGALAGLGVRDGH